MGLGVSLEQHSQIFLMHPPIQTNTLCEDIFLKVEILFEDSFTQSTSVKRLKYCDFVCFIANITLRRGGIWNLAQTQLKNLKTHWKIWKLTRRSGFFKTEVLIVMILVDRSLVKDKRCTKCQKWYKLSRAANLWQIDFLFCTLFHGFQCFRKVSQIHEAHDFMQ